MARLTALLVVAILGVTYVECQPNTTIACDPATKPDVYNNVDDSPVLLTGPGYNTGGYGPNEDCEWVINGNTKEVVLAFSSISVVEECVDCSCDSVQIFANTSQGEVLLYTLCGALDDPFVDDYLSSRSTIVRFKSDSIVQTTGFAISVSFADAACERTEGAPVFEPGFLTSPDFPAEYSVNLNCRWNFQAPAGQVVQWEFLFFSTEPGCVSGSGGFMFDFVEFFENDDTSQSLGRWASSIAAPTDALAGWTYKSRSNVTSARFISDTSNTAGGFNISYSFVSA